MFYLILSILQILFDYTWNLNEQLIFFEFSLRALLRVILEVPTMIESDFKELTVYLRLIEGLYSKVKLFKLHAHFMCNFAILNPILKY